LGCTSKSRLEVRIAEHSTTVGHKVLVDGAELLRAEVTAIVEEDAPVVVEAAVGLVEEPGQVLVLLADGPNQAGIVLLNSGEDVLGDVGQPAGLGDVECGKGSQGAFLAGGKDDGKTLHGLVEVGREWLLPDEVDEAVDGGLGIQACAVPDEDVLDGV
jgi:hypothetical protein